MNDEVKVSDNWTRNWQGSIAVKITAFVLWVLVIVVLGVAVALFQDVESELLQEYQDNADKFAYKITSILANTPSEQWLLQDEKFQVLLDLNQFSGLNMTVNGQEIRVGHFPVSGERINRILPIENPMSGDLITMELHHPKIHQLVEDKRNFIVLTMFIVLLIFGVFLTFSIRRIVHKPLQDLVSATQKISRGNHQLRLDMRREDEFGILARFFNQMLDRLIDQQHELEKALDQAKSASKSKSAFLANMSHELRTPLNAIIGYSEMLQEDAQESGMIHCVPDLQKIHTAGRHLLSLINSILDLSKIEAGKIEIDWTTFQAEQLVSDVVSTIQPLLEQNGNQFELNMPEALGQMESDSTKLRQILLNLLSNAAKFTEQGKISLQVTTFARADGQWIEFTVADTGIGIPKDKLDRLFTEFSQVDSSTTRKYGGTGLGLAISMRFCEMMGGTILVESEADKGSRFTVTLPMQRKTAELQQSQEFRINDQQPNSAVIAGRPNLGHPPDVNEPGSPARTADVLVVDDDPYIREMLEKVIHSQGKTAVLASNAEQALEIVKLQRPSLILLDLKLPGMNGYEFLKQFQQLPNWGDIPIVVMTIMDLDAKTKSQLAGKVVSVLHKGEYFQQDVMAHLREIVANG